MYLHLFILKSQENKFYNVVNNNGRNTHTHTHTDFYASIQSDPGKKNKQYIGRDPECLKSARANDYNSYPSMKI